MREVLAGTLGWGARRSDVQFRAVVERRQLRRLLEPRRLPGEEFFTGLPLSSGRLARQHADKQGVDKRLLAGRRYISPDLAEQLATRREAESAPHERLSAREFRVMRALAVGTSLTDIATQLSLSPKTVTTYRARVLTKLGIENNAELVRYCVAHKLID